MNCILWLIFNLRSNTKKDEYFDWKINGRKSVWPCHPLSLHFVQIVIILEWDSIHKFHRNGREFESFESHWLSPFSIRLMPRYTEVLVIHPELSEREARFYLEPSLNLWNDESTLNPFSLIILPQTSKVTLSYL